MNQYNTIDYFLKTAWQSVANKYNQIAAKYDFTQATGYILINIHSEGTSVSQIAASTGVKTTSLSRVLNNLEASGLIYRHVSDTDKRSVKVYLTELGKQQRTIAKDVVRDFNAYLHAALDEHQRQELISSLQKISQLAEAYSPEEVSELNR